MGTEDMAALQKMMEAGPAKVHVRLTTEQRRGLRDASVWGSLPGTSDEDIVIIVGIMTPISRARSTTRPAWR